MSKPDHYPEFPDNSNGDIDKLKQRLSDAESVLQCIDLKLPFNAGVKYEILAHKWNEMSRMYFEKWSKEEIGDGHV